MLLSVVPLPQNGSNRHEIKEYRNEKTCKTLCILKILTMLITIRGQVDMSTCSLKKPSESGLAWNFHKLDTIS